MVEHTPEHPSESQEAQAEVGQTIHGITATNRRALQDAVSANADQLSVQPMARLRRYTEWWAGVQNLRLQTQDSDGLIERTIRGWLAEVRSGARGKNPGQRQSLEALFQGWLAEMVPSRPPFQERPRTSFVERRPE